MTPPGARSRDGGVRPPRPALSPVGGDGPGEDLDPPITVDVRLLPAAAAAWLAAVIAARLTAPAALTAAGVCLVVALGIVATSCRPGRAEPREGDGSAVHPAVVGVRGRRRVLLRRGAGVLAALPPGQAREAAGAGGRADGDHGQHDEHDEDGRPAQPPADRATTAGGLLLVGRVGGAGLRTRAVAGAGGLAVALARLAALAVAGGLAGLRAERLGRRRGGGADEALRGRRGAGVGRGRRGPRTAVPVAVEVLTAAGIGVPACLCAHAGESRWWPGPVPGRSRARHRTHRLVSGAQPKRPVM